MLSFELWGGLHSREFALASLGCNDGCPFVFMQISWPWYVGLQCVAQHRCRQIYTPQFCLCIDKLPKWAEQWHSLPKKRNCGVNLKAEQFDHVYVCMFDKHNQYGMGCCNDFVCVQVQKACTTGLLLHRIVSKVGSSSVPMWLAGSTVMHPAIVLEKWLYILEHLRELILNWFTWVLRLCSNGGRVIGRLSQLEVGDGLITPDTASSFIVSHCSFLCWLKRPQP